MALWQNARGFPIMPTGLRISVVDAGTVITDERTGQSATIDDKTSVSKGGAIYCTDKVFEALKERLAQPQDTTTIRPS